MSMNRTSKNKSRMAVEGYLFTPYRGQHRFSFEVSENGRLSDLKISNRAYDFYWDALMRARPTLHEMLDEDRAHFMAVWKDSILEAASKMKQQLQNSPNSVLRKTIADSYVEFVNIKD